MMRTLFGLGLLFLYFPSAAAGAPFKLAEPISPEADIALAQRYGADYSPQTDAGKAAQAAAMAAAPNATVSAFWRDPCPAPSLTARAACANALRDKAAIASKFPWMDLVYAYDAKILQASADADAKRIKSEEFLARVKTAENELQTAITQRLRTAKAETQAQQASQRRAVLLPPAATACYRLDDGVNCTNN